MARHHLLVARRVLRSTPAYARQGAVMAMSPRCPRLRPAASRSTPCSPAPPHNSSPATTPPCGPSAASPSHRVSTLTTSRPWSCTSPPRHHLDHGVLLPQAAISASTPADQRRRQWKYNRANLTVAGRWRRSLRRCTAILASAATVRSGRRAVVGLAAQEFSLADGIRPRGAGRCGPRRRTCKSFSCTSAAGRCRQSRAQPTSRSIRTPGNRGRPPLLTMRGGLASRAGRRVGSHERFCPRGAPAAAGRPHSAACRAAGPVRGD